ncbi:MAG: urea ABC transporter permease subunit UrtB [Methylococcaceae bacterium]|nr:urea ABC transporter permease subunit UrtB [Methylococcaceae bacterium]
MLSAFSSEQARKLSVNAYSHLRFLRNGFLACLCLCFSSSLMAEGSLAELLDAFRTGGMQDKEAGLDKSLLSKINVNNRIRTLLKKGIALQQLNVADDKTRLAAVETLGKLSDPATVKVLTDRLLVETNQGVLEAIRRLVLIDQLQNGNKDERIKAIDTLKEFNSQEVVNQLQAMTEKEGESFKENDTDIRNLASAALTEIKGRIQAYAAVETVFFGLSLGAVLVLSAIGLAITFGVMGIINMAHGELMMLGAYTVYVLQQLMPEYLGLATVLSIPVAFLVAGLTGIAIERGIIRHLYGRPLETLLATFGVSLFLQQTVRSIFSPLNRSVSSPSWMSGSWQINDFLALTWNRFYILIFSLLVFAALVQILKRTKLGLEVRAVSQNRAMARAMGIPSGQVDALTFGLGSGIAGIAGVALSQITNVGPNLGQSYIVDSFMVVVFGGVGNLYGTLLAGFSLGIANKFLEPYAGAVLAKILVLIFIILFIQKRPRGLFPQKGRAVES